MWDLKQQTALVTGGTKGIGKATVIEFLKLGARVIFTARDTVAVEEMETEFKGQGYDITGIAADVSVEKDRDTIVNFLKKEWEYLDILVHNAGINIRKKALEYSPEEYKKVLDINLVSPFELSRMLHPLLRKSKYPSIINVSSVAGLQDVGTGTPYAMAKAGLLQQTRSLAVEWATDGIRVNAVSPWFTKTPLTKGFLAQDEKMEPILRRTPLKRVAEAGEMANIIAFLAMKESSYITGQNIVADGGMTINAI